VPLICQFSTWVRPGKRTPPSIKFPLGNSGKSYFLGDLVGSVFRGQAKWQIATLIVFRFGSVVVASSGETNGLLVLLEDFEVPSKKSAANFEQLRAVLIMKIRKKS
jgi:hypothetical protein